ncbi:efflux RND transporter periplasmic adaptor subunit [Alteromonas facilis]|uniref:efflux RND transporter periplasmic adaptor subunit n=1 Tax=Alteromonas facilis TaxID=2048004 RepID=UPI000C2914B8|nr:efflux RND transporter periplasmic adaptor subunit [Alteromonas facilis]
MNIFSHLNSKIVLCLLLTSSAALAQQTEPPPSLVEVESVKSESISEQVWMPGTVVSRIDANIASEVAGRIHWLADVGDIVQQGDILASLDDTRLQLVKGQHEVAIEKWQARVDLLTRKVARFSQMAALNNTSKDQLDDVSIELEMARQELAQAKYDRDIVQYQIDQSHVKAPFTAMIVERIQSPGEYTATGQNLLRIVDTQNIEVSVRAPLTTLPYLQAGTLVSIEQQSNSAQQPIRAIVPVGDARSRLMEVRVALDPQSYAIGSAVRVALPHSNAHQGLTVPRDALVLRKTGTYIFQVDEENQVRRIAVRTGIGQYNRIEVFGDVSDTLPVVIRGAERLREGQKVRYEPNEEVLTASSQRSNDSV